MRVRRHSGPHREFPKRVAARTHPRGSSGGIWKPGIAVARSLVDFDGGGSEKVAAETR